DRSFDLIEYLSARRSLAEDQAGDAHGDDQQRRDGENAVIGQRRTGTRYLVRVEVADGAFQCAVDQPPLHFSASSDCSSRPHRGRTSPLEARHFSATAVWQVFFSGTALAVGPAGSASRGASIPGKPRLRISTCTT